MANLDALKDFYAVGTVNYVHSNSKYFENILNKSTILRNFDNSTFTKALFNIIVLILEDHLSYWKKLADLAVQTAREKKLYIGQYYSVSHEKFLEDLNKAYAKLQTIHPSLGALYKYNEIKITTSFETKDSKEKIKKSKEEMIKNVKELYEAMAGIYNAETTLIAPFLNYLINSGITNFPSLSEVSPNFDRIKEKLDIVVKQMGAKDLQDLKNIIDSFNTSELDPNKNPDFQKISNFYALTTRQQTGKYLSSTWTGTNIDIPQWAGNFLEDVTNITLAQDNFARELMGSKDFIPDVGKKLKDRSITDKVIITTSHERKKINLGAGIKLKADTNLEKKYSAIDIVHTQYLESFLNSKPLSRSVIDIITWLRVNVQSLRIFANDEKLNDNIINKFKDLEIKIAGLVIIPRFLDGLYEYQTEKLSLPETGGELYHTSFLVFKGKIYWTYKFLEQIIQDIKNNMGDTSNTTTFKTSSSKETAVKFNTISAVELENLYLQKIKAMKNLDKVTYALLQNDPNVKSVIENLYLSSLSRSPISTINTVMKFETMINEM